MTNRAIQAAAVSAITATAVIVCSIPAAAAPPAVVDPTTGDIINGASRQHVTFAAEAFGPTPAVAAPEPGQQVWAATMTITAVHENILPVIPYFACTDNAANRYEVWWQHASPEGIGSDWIPQGTSRTGVIYCAVPQGVEVTGIAYTENSDPHAAAPLTSWQLSDKQQAHLGLASTGTSSGNGSDAPSTNQPADHPADQSTNNAGPPSTDQDHGPGGATTANPATSDQDHGGDGDGDDTETDAPDPFLTQLLGGGQHINQAPPQNQMPAQSAEKPDGTPQQPADPGSGGGTDDAAGAQPAVAAPDGGGRPIAPPVAAENPADHDEPAGPQPANVPNP